MADLISRAEAIKGLLSICPEKTEPGSFDEYGVTVLCGAVDVVIKGLPAVDAVHVVRCKDCMYFRPWRHDRGEDSRCEFWNTEMGAEDYCSQAIYLNNGRNDDGKAD